MRRSRLVVIGATALSFAWLLAGGCSSAGSDASLNNGANTGGSLSDAQGDATVVMPDASGNLGGGASTLSPLCGTGDCVPDESLACLGYTPPPATTGGSGGAGSTESAGAAGETATGGASLGGEGVGGNGGQVEVGGAGPGGQGGNEAGGADPGTGGASAQAGASGAEPMAPPPSFSCQVTRQAGQVLRECQLAGLGKVNAPCFSAADCLPALGCITEGDAGRCLPYCCDGDSACQPGTYCAERELRRPSGTASDESKALSVPVCVPADDCSLEDLFPCPEGTDCRCKGNTACTVVRADATTTCLTPGTGQQGDACPCAWNHVCSSVTQKCVKICRTDPAKQDCGEQKCQASSELPLNFGVCVGPVR